MNMNLTLELKPLRKAPKTDNHAHGKLPCERLIYVLMKILAFEGA